MSAAQKVRSKNLGFGTEPMSFVRTSHSLEAPGGKAAFLDLRAQQIIRLTCGHNTTLHFDGAGPGGIDSLGVLDRGERGPQRRHRDVIARLDGRGQVPPQCCPHACDPTDHQEVSGGQQQSRRRHAGSSGEEHVLDVVDLVRR